MLYLGRVVGVAALALSTTALFGCYAPPPPSPPMAALSPDRTWLPAPPPTVGMTAPDQTPNYPPPAYPLASAGPTPLTPYNSDYATPQYGSTASGAEAPSNAGTTVIVAPYAPPPRRIETPPPAPSALAIWQPGHWGWNGTQYSWMAGHYVERPSPTANWMRGHWQQGPAGWTWIDGHWS